MELVSCDILLQSDNGERMLRKSIVQVDKPTFKKVGKKIDFALSGRIQKNGSPQ